MTNTVRTGRGVPSWFPRGMALLRDPTLNKSTAFTDSEREALGIRGLLPPHVSSQEEQVARVLENFRRKPTAVAEVAYTQDLATVPRPDNLLEFVKSQMYDPHYYSYV